MTDKSKNKRDQVAGHLYNRNLTETQRRANVMFAGTAGLARKRYVLDLKPEEDMPPSIIGAFRFGSATGYMLDSKAFDMQDFFEVDMYSEEEPDKLVGTRKVSYGRRDAARLLTMTGAAPLNKTVNGFDIPCGVCLIVGGGGVGKTPLAWSLASSPHDRDERPDLHSFGVSRIGEPLAGYTSDDVQTVASIMQNMLSCSDVVIDSIKDLLSSARGAAMKSGLSRDALSVLSSWSSLACVMGVTLYVPVNPSTAEPEVVEVLAEAARSNATCTIVARSEGVWDYFARTGEGLPRKAGQLVTSFDPDGWMTVNMRNFTAPKATVQRKEDLVANVSPDALSRAMRRALTLTNS